MSSVLARKRFYARHHQADTRSSVGNDHLLKVPADIVRLESHSPCFLCGTARGCLVRLHILGDFYSVDYANLWAEALEAYPALHIFGYTARDPEGGIGKVIREMLGVWPARFHVRFSGFNGPANGSVVIDHADETDHVICPAQTGKTDCCATCALCWHSDRTIAFLRH